MNAQRLSRVTEAMKKEGLDALFVSNPKNVLYLTGFKTTMPGEVQHFGDPEGYAVIHDGVCHLLCDGRYIAGAQKLPGVSARKIESPTTAKVFADQITQIVGSAGRTIGYERNAVIHSDATALLELTPNLKWKAAEHILTDLRVRKTPEEIELIRKAQAITGQCFEHMKGWIRVGMTEKQVAVEIETFLRANSEGNSFAPIVGFGETSCNPHYTPSATRKLEKNQIVLLDFGGIYEGYCGDMTRMLYFGKADARYREVYDLVLQAQLKCLAAVRAGVTCHELDSICRDYFKAKNCADAFMHGTGHGVGLAIHEDPRLKQTFQTKIASGMVFSVEPGLYYSGWGGIRIEDLVAATEAGHENLTTTPKDLIEIPV